MIAPVIAGGNACVVVAAEPDAYVAITFGEVLATSDVPAGVVNLLTGSAAEIGPHLAAHADVNALDLTGADAELRPPIEQAASDTVKRVYRPKGDPGLHRRAGHGSAACVPGDQDGLAPDRRPVAGRRHRLLRWITGVGQSACCSPVRPAAGSPGWPGWRPARSWGWTTSTATSIIPGCRALGRTAPRHRRLGRHRELGHRGGAGGRSSRCARSARRPVPTYDIATSRRTGRTRSTSKDPPAASWPRASSPPIWWPPADRPACSATRSTSTAPAADHAAAVRPRRPRAPQADRGAAPARARPLSRRARRPPARSLALGCRPVSLREALRVVELQRCGSVRD